MTYADLGQYEAAITKSEQALLYEPESEMARSILAKTYIELGLYEKALQVLTHENMLQNSSMDYLELYLQTALTTGRSNVLDKLSSSQLSQLQKEPVRFARINAKALLWQGEITQAELALEKLVEETAEPLLLLDLISAKIILKKCKEIYNLLALDDIHEIDRTQILLREANCKISQENWPEAETILSKAIASQPKSLPVSITRIQTLNLLSKVMTHQKRISEAAIYDQVISKNSIAFHEEQSHLLRAETLVDDNKMQESILFLKTVLPYAEEKADTSTLLCQAYIRRVELTKASKFCDIRPEQLTDKPFTTTPSSNNESHQNRS